MAASIKFRNGDDGCPWDRKCATGVSNGIPAHLGFQLVCFIIPKRDIIFGAWQVDIPRQRHHIVIGEIDITISIPGQDSNIRGIAQQKTVGV